MTVIFDVVMSFSGSVVMRSVVMCHAVTGRWCAEILTCNSLSFETLCKVAMRFVLLNLTLVQPALAASNQDGTQTPKLHAPHLTQPCHLQHSLAS